jgi:hypothetical protein
MKVRVRDNRQVVDNDGQHHLAGAKLDMPEAEARTLVKLGAVELVDDMPEGETSSQRQGRANVRKRIAEELAVDADRSNREIAEVVGCSDKTVASVRKAHPEDKGVADTDPPHSNFHSNVL